MKLPASVKNNLLLKITSVNSLAVVLKMVVTFVTQKVIAVVLGPAGVAQIGNFKNLLPMVESLSTVGIFNGVVKYVAENKETPNELQKLFSTAVVFVLFGSTTVAVFLFFGAPYLNDWVFGANYNFVFVFRVLAIATPFIAFTSLLNSVINGLSEYKVFLKLSIYVSIFTALLVISLVFLKNLDGALFAMAIAPVFQLLIFGYLYVKVLKPYFNFRALSFQITYGNRLVVYIVMAFLSIILSGFIDIRLRTFLTREVAIIDAGYWTGMTNISNQYFTLVSAVFSLYVLPKFATIKTSSQFRAEVGNIYKTLLPLFFIGCVVVYLCREWIILIVQSPEFLGMKPLFKWQLLGDFVKIASLVISYQFLAKGLVKEFVITEILSLVFFYGLSMLFIADLGAEGIVLAHFIRYLIYYGLVVFVLRKHLFGDRELPA